jgi:hypothetical protein
MSNTHPRPSTPQSKPRPPTPAEINAQQKRDAEAALARKQQAAPEKPGTAVAPVSAAVAPVTPRAPRSLDALARNLGNSSRPTSWIAFHGVDGNFPSDSGDLADGRHFVAFPLEVWKGFIRFNGTGVPPETKMRCAGEDLPPLTRDDLEDGYAQRPGKDGTLQYSWQEQTALPLITADDAGEMFSFIARNRVSLIAVDTFLDRYLHHPKGRQGLLPIVELATGSYINKKFGNTKKPKPNLKIVGWVSRDGNASNAPALKAGTPMPDTPPSPPPMDDEIPF